MTDIKPFSILVILIRDDIRDIKDDDSCSEGYIKLRKVC